MTTGILLEQVPAQTFLMLLEPEAMNAFCPHGLYPVDGIYIMTCFSTPIGLTWQPFAFLMAHRATCFLIKHLILLSEKKDLTASTRGFLLTLLLIQTRI